MRSLRIMTVTFDSEIDRNEITSFRGAVIEAVGLEHDLYHNHNNAPDAGSKFLNRYPLIQYRRIRKKPTLVFIENGIEAAQHFFARPDWSLVINGKKHKMGVEEMKVKNYRMGVEEGAAFTYNLYRWQALNQRNFKEFVKIKNQEERVKYLESKLMGQINAFADGVGWFIKEWVEIKIVDVLKSREEPYRNADLVNFDIQFQSNLLLPPYIGLGKGVSIGYGSHRRMRDRIQQPVGAAGQLSEDQQLQPNPSNA